ncbi:MAG: molybdenum ABC transporter ATP-binding protein [Cyanobium sp. NAT70]|nr:molybdenum ABC transporter ATP-binding protein [Cyanobium sp. NAT70]|tara:strand:+ start:3009 stop:3797 length:789 start_codon:yes stop_codon:yes gene_type:complete
MTAGIWFDAQNVEAWLGGRAVISELNLQLRLGESTTILGPNGAGKSTLVKLIDRNLYPIVKPDSHLHLFGSSNVNLWQLRRRLGVVSSELETRFLPQISAREIVLSGFFGSMRLGRDQTANSNQTDTVTELLTKLNLASIADQRFGSLSDGQKRRLMIARALVHDPAVLVLDEPSRALDLKACHQLLQSLRQLCRNGTTLVLITHRIDTIIPEMGRVLFINQGKLCGDGNPQQQLQAKPLSALFDTPLSVVEHQGFRQVLPA